MTRAEPAAEPLPPPTRSAAQARVLRAALDLFTEHGVSGTSLQMIADAVGVTKAAVYHQFQSKEDIVVAAVEDELGRLEPALAAAEAHEPSSDAVEALLAEVIDRGVERRRLVGTLLHDPVIARLLAERAPFQLFMDRLYRVMLGGDTSPEARVRAAMVATGLGSVAMHPLVADLDDDTLRALLLSATRRFLELGA